MARSVICAIILGAVSSAVMADVPRLIQYQGKLLTSTGTALTGSVAIRVRLYDDPIAPGQVLFDESHPAVTLNRGLFSILVGSLTPGGVPDSAIAPSTVYMGVSIDGAAELSPRRRLATTPYTVKARSAEQLVRPGSVTPALAADASGRLAAGTPTPDPSAAFDLSSSSGGFLPPRMTTGQRNGIASPAIGLLVFNTDSNCLEMWSGMTWRRSCFDCGFSAPVPSNNGPVCEGETLQLTATDIPGATYAWIGPNGFSSTDQNPSIENATPAAGGPYLVTATLEGCTTAPATTVATVYPTPLSPTVSNNGPLCAGDTLVLTASSVPGAIYTWSGPDGFESNSQNPSIGNVSPANDGEYTLVVSVNGCPATPAATDAQIAATPSAPSDVNGPSSVCVNSSGIVYSVLDVPSATSYTWSAPPGASVASGQGTAFATINFGSSSGNVCVTASNNCGTSSQACRGVTVVPITSCSVILACNPAAPSGVYSIDPDGAGGLDPFDTYCDMTTDGGGWTIVFANPGASSPWLSHDVEQGGNALSYQAFNVNRLKKEAISAISTESLFKRSAGPWLKANHALFDNGLTGSGNQHPHWQVTVTASNGDTASDCQMGYSNFNINTGGDYGITTSGQVFDHHNTSDYYHLNSGCANHHLYQHGGTYNVNTGVGSWSSTAGCDGGGTQMGPWYAGMR